MHTQCKLNTKSIIFIEPCVAELIFRVSTSELKAHQPTEPKINPGKTFSVVT